MVFKRFTDRARHVVVLAQEEARRLNHSYIGTEHLLLGLLREEDGVAAKALEALGISLQTVRLQVEEIIGEGLSPPGGRIPFTPRAKEVLELSLREALELGHDYIGTEHILLGLVQEGEGVAAQALRKLNADSRSVRQEVVALLSGRGAAPAEEVEMHPAGGILQEAYLHDASPEEPEWPACPRCRASLEETARFRVLDVPAQDEGEARAVPFAFCSKCGTWLGTIG